MDAEALFPSLALKEILGGIWTLVTESSLEFKDVDVNEMAKFLAIEYTREELVRGKVISCIPKRKVESDGTSRRPPTLAYLDSNHYTRVRNGARVLCFWTNIH